MSINFSSPNRTQALNFASGATSSSYFVGDAASLALSIITSTTSASRVTVNGSLDDGFATGLGTASASGSSGNWSIVTAITGGSGIYTLARGLRWIQVTRPDFTTSAASNMTVLVSTSY